MHRVRILLALLVLLGVDPTFVFAQEGFSIRAGEDSLKFKIALGQDERRGEAPEKTPMEVKRQCAFLLERLRKDGKGLKAQTEFAIESYFTVADAFEADGLLVQSVDTLNDLRGKLEALVAARQGTPFPHSLIEAEEDILPFRDSHNLHMTDGKYMAGAQPTEKGYRWLKSKGVTTVINLRLPSEHERNLVENLGMRYIHIPWTDEEPPTLDQVKQMLAAVDLTQGRVFQHCLRGIGRDMTMASCYLIAKYGKSAQELIEEGKQAAPRWVSDQKRDPATGEPVQFQLIRQFERTWRQEKPD